MIIKKKKAYRVVVKQEFCKGCNLCIEYCKPRVLASSPSLNEMGYHYAEAAKPGECTGCMACTLVCPDLVIEVYGE
ncbi:MAG TPA: 4Fe-4S dicluster domain-containing protein [Syntrophales bacterium]|jgi:2-oxoglutarate ferredoxin oxidoreductase subunit delta|nr:4Fe-4S dicluster domain-containing protein [Syntrophales bacterium]HQA83295.1 4Fe-4S dicluster domain-containing protein [Syntrophales bacterium]